MAFSDFDIMSRCKKILEHLADVTDVAINNVKSVIDTVNTNVNSVKSYTTTNNTASETGILSQKLSWLITVNKNHGSVERTSAGSQNWTCPAGVYAVYVIAAGGCGGGGGGGGGKSSFYRYAYSGVGGGSGSVSPIIFSTVNVTPGTVYALTVGAGGNGGTAGEVGNAGGAGGAGGVSKFGTLIEAPGGAGGAGGAGGKGSDDSKPSNPNDSSGGAKVNVGKLIGFLYNLIDSMAGKSGTWIYASSPSSNRTGHGPAGASVSILNLKSGAGGAGGMSSTSREYISTAGSAGSAGSTGYIKVIW